MRHVVPCVAYAALAVLYTWPLVGHLGAAVPRDLGDPLLSVWTLWWNARTLPLTESWWQGPIFHPAAGTLAFSDHRLGLGPIATPLILLGAAPLVAYNVAFLLSFVLSAAAAYGLAWSLTRARLPALAAGCIFGFHPFRATHLEHLELLAAFWLPAAFWALHAWHHRRSTAALVAVAGTLTALAYTSGYYFFYGGIAIAMWVLWFERGTAPRDLARLALALLVPGLLIAPVLWRYRAIHDAYGFSRPITEIESFSADLGDLLTSPSLLAVWRLPWPPVHPERALFPGVAALAVLLWAWWWSGRAPVARASRLRTALLVVGILAVGAALIASRSGGVAFSLGPIAVSLRVAYKPLSIAAVAFGAWFLTSSPVRAAWQARSPLAFYTLATAGLWLLALGPTARVFGERVLYKAPYAWLMVLPGFADGFRVPARFAMVAAMTSAAAAALALRHRGAALSPRQSRSAGVALVAVALADGWIRPLPLHQLPAPLELPAALRPDDVVLELPRGVLEDAAAMYRATIHGRRLANGMSGYQPPHYVALGQALEDGDLDALAALPRSDEVVAFVSRDPSGTAVSDALARAPWAAAIGTTATHRVFRLRQQASPPPLPAREVVVARLQVSEHDDGARAMRDHDERTAWQAAAQRGSEVVLTDLGQVTAVSGVDLALGPYAASYPRELSVETSTDGQTWSAAWQMRTAGLVVASAITTARSPVVAARFATTQARFVRLRQVATSARPWAVAELRVVAP